MTSLRYLHAKFHHPSLGASPPNRGNRISCVHNSRKTENRNSVNNSGIGILCSKNSNERLAFPAVAGLLVVSPGDAPATITQYVAWMERQFNACQTPGCMYLSIFSSFRVIRCLSQCVSPKNRYFYHISVSSGDAPGAITLNVVWIKREFDAYKLSSCMCPSNYKRF